MTHLTKPYLAAIALFALACSAEETTGDDSLGTGSGSMSTAGSTMPPGGTEAATDPTTPMTANSMPQAPTGMPQATGGTPGTPNGGSPAMGGTPGLNGGAGPIAAGGMPAAGMGGGTAGTGTGGGTASDGTGGSPMGGAAGTGMGGASGMSGGGGTGGGGGGAPPAGEFTLTAPWDSEDGCSPDNMDACSLIPADNTMVQGNANEMPDLSWTEGPPGTQSYALVYHDHSFQMGGMPFVHWALWNIPADVTSVGMGSIPPDAEEASIQGGSWAGSGACGNVYELLLYAIAEPTIDAADQTAVRNMLRDADDSLVLAVDSVFGATGAPNCN